MAHQVISIFAGTKGLLDDVPINKVAEFERALLKHIDDEFPEFTKEITDTGEMSDTLAERIKEVITNFSKNFDTKD